MKIRDSQKVDGEATVIRGTEADTSVRAALLRSWNPTLKGMVTT